MVSEIVAVKLNTTPKIVRGERWFHTKRPIVVADAEPQIRKLIKRVLTNQGFTVFEAEDGLEAFATICQLHGEISILISDIDMPYLDGASLCKKVKDRFPSVPVLLMSANPEPRCNVGDVFLRKPSQMHLLSRVVADFCLESTQVA